MGHDSESQARSCHRIKPTPHRLCFAGPSPTFAAPQAAASGGNQARDLGARWLFGVLGAPAVAAEETARALQPNADASAGWMGADIDQVNEER